MIPRLGWARAGITPQRIDIWLLDEICPLYACAFLPTPHERRVSLWPKFTLGFYGAGHGPTARKARSA